MQKIIAKRDEGIAEERDSHVLDATSILKDSRERIATRYIANFWLNSNALPPTHSNQLGNAMGKVHVEGSNALDDF